MISPTMGIAPMPKLATQLPNIEPITTLAPAAKIFAAALNRSPQGRLSGLKNTILAASTKDAQDSLMIFTIFLAVVKNMLQSVVVNDESAPAIAPCMNLSQSLYICVWLFQSPF